MRSRSPSIDPTTSMGPSQPTRHPNFTPFPHFWQPPSFTTYTYPNLVYPPQMGSFAATPRGCYGPAFPSQPLHPNQWQPAMTYSYPGNFDPTINAVLSGDSTSRPTSGPIETPKHNISSVPDASDTPSTHGLPTIESLEQRAEANGTEELAMMTETEWVMARAAMDELKIENEALKKRNGQLEGECERFRMERNLSSTLLLKLHQENAMLINQLRNPAEKSGPVASPDTAQGDDFAMGSGEAKFDEPLQQTSREPSPSPSVSEVQEFGEENETLIEV